MMVEPYTTTTTDVAVFGYISLFAKCDSEIYIRYDII